MADENVILRVELGGEGPDDRAATTRPPETVLPEPGVGNQLDEQQLTEQLEALRESAEMLKELVQLNRRMVEIQNTTADAAKQAAGPVTSDDMATAVGQAVKEAIREVGPLISRGPGRLGADVPTGSADPNILTELDQGPLGELRRRSKELADEIAAEREELARRQADLEAEAATGDEPVDVGGGLAGRLGSAAGTAIAGGVGGGVFGTALGVAGGVLIAKGIEEVIQSLRALGEAAQEAIADMQKASEAYSAGAAQAAALADVQVEMARMRAGQRLDSQSSALTEAQTQWQLAIVDLQAIFAEKFMPVAIPFIKLATALLNIAIPLFYVLWLLMAPLAEVVDLLVWALKWLKATYGIFMPDKDAESIDTVTAEMREFLDPDAFERKRTRRRR